jgi:hypothetical protein
MQGQQTFVSSSHHHSVSKNYGGVSMRGGRTDSDWSWTQICRLIVIVSFWKSGWGREQQSCQFVIGTGVLCRELLLITCVHLSNRSGLESLTAQIWLVKLGINMTCGRWRRPWDGYLLLVMCLGEGEWIMLWGVGRWMRQELVIWYFVTCWVVAGSCI